MNAIYRLATILAAAFVANLSSACTDGASARGPARSTASLTSAQTSALTPGHELNEALVGKWQFVYDDRIRAQHEARLAREISDPAALAAAKREAEREAAESEIEFTADQRFISRVHGAIHLTNDYDLQPGSDANHVIVIPHGTGHGGRSLPVSFPKPGTLVLNDFDKGDLVYVRR